MSASILPVRHEFSAPTETQNTLTYDALAMHAVAAEMRERLEGGRIDRALLLGTRQVGLEIFARGARLSVVFDLAPDASRVFLTGERLRRTTDRVTPFSLLLRKYVAGSRIVSIQQPRLERLLRLSLSARVDQGVPREIELVAEVMGRRSNLVLVDEDGSIMDVLARVPPAVNPPRPLLPHLRYTPPPAESKTDPRDPVLGRILERGAQPDDLAWRTVVQHVAGFSPLAAREAVARATGASETLASDVRSWDDLATSTRHLAEPIETGEWQPTVARRDGRVLDFAPYRLTQFEDAEVAFYASMGEAIIVGAQRAVSAPAFDRLKRPLLEALAARLEQARRKRSSLERSLAAADNADELREAGQAILSSAHAILPGATAITWEGRRIDLYPTLSPAENAQAYFKRYADSRDAKSSVPPLLDQVAGEIEHLEEMAMHVQMADDEKTLTGLRRELEDAGVVRKPTGKKRDAQKTALRSGPGSGVYSRLPVDGAEILVGRSAAGNDWVTFHVARPEDLWLHARGVPGAHVILRPDNGRPTENQILAAAQVAAGHSAARDGGTVEVDYVLRKYVRKIRGGPPGRVTFRNERTIAVAPDNATERAASLGLHSKPPVAPRTDSDALGELVPELLLGHVADDPIDFLSTLEEDQGRDPGDAESPGHRRVGIHVDLGDL